MKEDQMVEKKAEKKVERMAEKKVERMAALLDHPWEEKRVE